MDPSCSEWRSELPSVITIINLLNVTLIMRDEGWNWYIHNVKGRHDLNYTGVD